MRIAGLHVDGFGVLHDLRVDDVGPGTTVVLGPNEAGKSTLHAFIARTLFGYPRRNDATGRRRRDPVAGGVHGGMLVVLDEDGGRWEIHRSTVRTPRLRVVRPDGREVTGADAVAGLVDGSLDLAAYEQVHAIDLDALSGLGALAGAALDDLLFDAATVGTGRSLRSAHAEAAERRDALWTPTATTRPLAAALTDRTEARVSLAEARAAAARAVEDRRARDAAARRLDELTEERRGLVAEAVVLDATLAALPVHVRLRQAAAVVGAGPTRPLPSGLADRARAAGMAMSAADAAIREADDELAELDDAIAAIPVDDRLAAVADRVDEARVLVGVLDRDRARLDEAIAAREEARTRHDGAVHDLGPGWDAQRVAAVRTDGVAREQLVLAASTLGRAAEDDRRARAAATAAVARTGRVQDLRTRRLEARPEAPPLRDVVAAEHALATLRAARSVPTAAAAREPQRPSARWGLRVAVGGTLVLVVAAAATAVVDGAGPAAVVALVIAAVVGGVVAGRLLGGGGPPRPAAAGHDVVQGAGVVASDAISPEVVAAASTLGLDTAPTPAAVATVAVRVAEARTAAETAARIDDALVALDDDVLAARAEEETATNEAAHATAALDDATRAWRAQCVAVGIQRQDSTATIDPSVGTVVHELAVEAGRARALLERAADIVVDLGDQVDQTTSTAVAVVAAATGADAAPEAAGAAFAEVATAVAADRDARAARARHRAARERVVAGRARVVARRAAAADDLTTALATADVTDLDALGVREQRDAAVADARVRVREATDELGPLLASTDGQAVRSLLEQPDAVTWTARRTAVAAELERLDVTRDQALRTHTTAAAAVERLAADDAVPRAAQDVEAAQAMVDRLAAAYVVADTAVTMLEQTLAAFESAQQPPVLAHAGALLATATRGAWDEVRLLDGRLVVDRTAEAQDDGSDHGGGPVPADHLSRGATEQLYLCLRLALAADRADRTGTSLPLLIDDLFGSTDPERAPGVARVLAAAARRHQVWLFTCDPRTAALVVDADEDARVLRMAGGGARVRWQTPAHS